MKLRVPAFYRDFACIAGACPDSCCQGWEVDADPASMNPLKLVTSTTCPEVALGVSTTVR